MSIEEYEHKGLTIRIDQDQDPESPREWCNSGKMVCWHRNYKLGDEHECTDPDHMWVSLLDEIDIEGEAANKILMAILSNFEDARDDYKDFRHDYKRWGGHSKTEIREIFVKDSVAEYLNSEVREAVQGVVEDHYVILPLYLYDHSGITMNTTGFSCGWDSGQVGFIYMDMETAEREWKACKEHKEKYPESKFEPTESAREYGAKRLKHEVEVYDMYLTGQVFGYTVEDEDGNHLDSCWGYYGEDDVKQEAERSADHYADKLAKDFQI